MLPRWLSRCFHQYSRWQLSQMPSPTYQLVYEYMSPYGTFLRKPTMRECQKLRDFSPCGVSRGILPANQFRRQESEKPMNVEIWSDVACPWCYIGVLD